MNLRSIRFRLSLWYSLAFFVSTAIVFGAFFVITRQTLYSQTDQTILSHGQAIVRIIENGQSSMMTGAFNQGVISGQFAELPGMLVIIADPTGKIVNSSQTGESDNPIIKDLLEKSSGIIKPTLVDRTVGKSELRMAVFPINQNGSLIGLALVGHPVEVIHKSLNNLLVVLLGVYFLFLLPTVAGSFLLAKGVMQPITDISAKLKSISSKNLEDKVPVPKTKDEIEELATTFNTLLERLSQAFTRERQFIGDVAHEMKTPLATIRSSVEVALSKDRNKQDYKEILSETLVDVNRLSSTFTNVLDLAWSEVDHTKAMKDSFNLSGLVLEIKDLTEKLAAEKQIKISGHIEPNINIFGRRDKVSRAILNVVDNAVKYTPSKGRVVLNLRKNDNKALLEVDDTGIGISREELPKVFDRFYRGAKTEKTLGSGLGLAIAQAIISAHGGEISISSTIKNGTIVIISLPLKPS